MTEIRLDTLRPLFFGRLGRVLAGLATLVVILAVGPADLGPWWTIGLLFLGVSFLIGGLVANPSCEITALPNLILASDKKVHCL